MYRSVIILAVISAIADGASDPNYRLNTPIKPKAYSIAVTPYFDTGDAMAFTFDGQVDIALITDSVTKQIKLHSEDLIFTDANVTVTNGASVLNLDPANPLVFDKNYTFAIINLQEDLQVGPEYTLKIIYRGPIREDLYGFSRMYYLEKGVKKWLGATQMESVHARKVFPCFDEPGLKATFTLTIDRPAHFKPSLSNTKLQQNITLPNGYVREIFYPTPVMSTYLVAFLVSEYQGVVNISNGVNEFGVYTRPEALNQTEFTMDFGQRVVEALGDYFGIDYYSTDSNLKLDHVSLPDFKPFAMENWGLVKYIESSLLYVLGESDPQTKYSIASIIAHETTHMWFGNLVTCHWWSDTWLNEGFATYFQDYITSLIEPDLGSGNALVVNSVYTAYSYDDKPAATPLSNEANSPAEISNQFGRITYNKGGSVIRMMHHLMGDYAFKLGLNTYLQANKFSVGTPQKMYEALDLGVKTYNSFVDYKDTDVTEVMSSWVSKPGHPVLYVEVNYEDDSVILTQKRFYTNSKYSSNETYLIPVTFTTGSSPDFKNTKPAFIMKTSTHKFSIANISQEHSWVLFNIQETGFYRVNYDDHLWHMISKALKGDDRLKIHHLNRAKVVNDLFAFYFADMVKFDLVKDVLEFLQNEEDYSVWVVTIANLQSLMNRYESQEAATDIKAYILQLLENPIARLGYEVKPTDSFDTVRSRLQVLMLACQLNHEGCIENTLKLYRGLKENGTEITPSLRLVAYITGLRFGNADDFDFLQQRKATTNVATEADMIEKVLGFTTDMEKLKSYLVSIGDENNPTKKHNLMVPVTNVLANYSRVHVLMDELKENYTLWSTIYPSMDAVMATIASALRTEEDFAEFEAFLALCQECTEQTSTRMALERARETREWAVSHHDDILTSLRSHGATLTPSMILMITLTVFLEMIQCFA